MKNICIIGAGRQGTACAYDLVRFLDNINLVFLDIDINQSKQASNRINELLGYKAKYESFDIFDKEKLIDFLDSFDLFLSSVPYHFNIYLTDIAIESKTSMVDLGGHTLNVKKQLSRTQDAIDAGITIVPDCGMGPGMNVSVALMGIESMDTPKEVYVWDGGLPLNPIAPWNYSLFFNINGLTNEYDGSAYFIEDRKVKEFDCFELIENLEFENIGKLEAAVTSGGLSTMPWTYEGKLNVLQNKTLRYPGHWEQMIAYRQLGLFDEQKINFNGQELSPRDFYHYLLAPKLEQDDNRDICLMRVDTIGSNNGKPAKNRIELSEKYDEETKFLAMEKWTGWHASIVMIEILDGNIAKGAIPIEKALPGSIFHDKAIERSYKIKITNR